MTANPLSTIPPIGPATGMTPPPPTGKLKPIDPVRLLRQHILILVVTGVIGAVCGSALYYVLRKTSPKYTSSAQLLVDARQATNPWDVATGSGLGSSSDATSFMNNESNFIRSDEIIRDALVRDDVQQTSWYRSFKGDNRRAREEMQENMLRVNPIPRTTLINLSMTAPNPDDSRVLLREVVETYLNRKKLLNDQAGSSLRRLFLSEENRSDDDVRSIRNSMRRFIADNDIKTLGVAASEEQITFNTLTRQQLELKSFLAAAQGSYQSLLQTANNPEMTDEENAYLKSLPQIATRQEELRTLEENRRQLLDSGKQENHPQIKLLDGRRDAVEFKLQRELEKELGELRALQIQSAAKNVEGLIAQLAALEPDLAATSTRLQELTQRLNEYSALEIDLEIAMAKKQRADAALDELRQISKREDYVRVRIQTGASEAQLTFPKLIVVPGVTFLMIGAIGGLLVLREMLDQRVRSPQDLKLLPLETNLLGLVPHASEDPSGGSTPERTVELSPTGLLTESYRQVRTAVLSKMDRRGYKTLVCVSAQPKAGTSTVVQNLAASLAYNGRSVLIVDANFRRPAQHTFLNCDNRRGLVDVLKDDASLDDVIVNHSDMSLALLPTGLASDAPPEMLEGSAFRALLGDLETRYDIVLIDTPPALLTSDSQMLSKHVDAIAVIVQAGEDKRGMLGRMLGQLDGQRADVLGIILNGVKSSAGGYFRKSYEDFYRYRQTEAEPKRPASKKSAKAKKKAASDRQFDPARDGDLDLDNLKTSDSAAAIAPAPAHESLDLDDDLDIDLNLDDLDGK
ncbi:MAG: polysaccharide biosynthesis tyrosine autokinase [Planctomycetota bacterium]